MTNETKLPDFHVRTELHGDPYVTWHDDGRRYHIWLTNAGETQSDILHSNPLVRDPNARRDEHRTLNIHAKKWAPIVAGILERIKVEDLIAKARAEAAEKAAIEAADRQRQDDARMLAALGEGLELIPREVGRAISALPAADRIAFARAIRRANCNT